MTQTTDTGNAVYTLTQLDTDAPTHQDYLELIELAKTELEALEAGMLNQTPAARSLQNAMWGSQNVALIEIIRAALAAGVCPIKITTITHRENW